MSVELDQAFDGRVVEAQVQDGVHHAGHGELRAGADRDEQRVGGVAELLAGLLFDIGERRLDFVHQAVGHLLPQPRVFVTGVGGDGEAGGDGQADVAHLRQVGALAAQFVTHRRVGLFKKPHALGVRHEFFSSRVVPSFVFANLCSETA